MQQSAINICKKLRAAGYEALFAGGAVRDFLLGQEPVDIDIATNAKPEEIEKIFEKSYTFGKHFGVILIEENGHHFEIATFRSDGGYTDGRRPDAVYFTDKKEDALRRDFTVNALFWDPVEDKIHDFVDGVRDLKQRVLRFVGNPETRIREDNLRILRAVRFKNALDFTFASGLEEVLKNHAKLVKKVSAERVKTELEKMLISGGRISAFHDLEHLGLLQILLPEVAILKNTPDAHRDRNVFDHVLECMKFLPKNADAILVWALLFHDTGKADTLKIEPDRNHFPEHERVSETIAKQICARLKFSRFETDKIAWLARNHIPFYQSLEMNRAHRLHFFDHPFFIDLIELCRCDALGDDGNDSLVRAIEREYHEAREQKLLPQFLPELLDGKEIMTITGLAAGEAIGELKHDLRNKQLAGEITTTAQAKKWLTSKLKNIQK